MITRPVTSSLRTAQPATAVKGKMDALTSLRFFAAIFVVMGHTIEVLTHWTWAPGLRVVFMGFDVAVSFFFLLSGYILAVVYIKGTRPINKRKFFAARFARIYPLFFLTLILDTPNLLWYRVGLYGWHVAKIKTAVSFIASMFMLQAWTGRLRGIDPPNWSLSTETLFYLTFPFIALALWRLRGARLWLSAVGIYVAGQLVVLAVAPHMNKLDAASFPPLHMSTFVLGILLARWQTSYEEAHMGRLVAKPAVVYTVVALTTAVFAALFLFPRVPEASLNDGLLAPIFCAYIWAFSHPGNVLSRLLSARWLVLLGESSFALYLIHIPIFHLLQHLNIQASVLNFVLYVSGCIGLSILCFLYFESPARKMVAARLIEGTHDGNERDGARRADVVKAN